MLKLKYDDKLIRTSGRDPKGFFQLMRTKRATKTEIPKVMSTQGRTIYGEQILKERILKAIILLFHRIGI